MQSAYEMHKISQELEDILSKRKKKLRWLEKRELRRLSDNDLYLHVFDRWWNEIFLENTREATVKDYKAWLEGWSEQGAPFDDESDLSVFDISFSEYECFYVPLQDLVTFPGYGALEYNLIVPEGVKLYHKGEAPHKEWVIGHGSVYHMEDFSYIHTVYRFQDV